VFLAMTNSERKAMNALDNITEEFGKATFQSLAIVIKLATRACSVEVSEQWLKRLDELETFVLRYMRQHFQTESDNTHHCMRFALGTPDDPPNDAPARGGRKRRVSKVGCGRALKRTHQHTKFCEECNELQTFIVDLVEFIDKQVGSAIIVKNNMYCLWCVITFTIIVKHTFSHIWHM
jgi:hypothetical protein